MTLALVVLLAAGSPPAPCSAPEFRQFDFWAGDWEVSDPSGKKVGTNRIDVVQGGCALHENWTSVKASRGESLNFYDKNTGKWTQAWIGNDGGALLLTGGMKGDAMVLEGEAPAPDGTPAKQRIRWTPRPDGTVRQHWETSTDGGKSWTTAFDGIYARKPAGARR